jgi:catechol 2,3-dioxygenase-like lactoylglutathione lyase family enzyme
VTPNIERMCRFYCEVLGFRQIWRPDFPFRGAWLFGYGLQIHLIEPEAGFSGPTATPELSARRPSGTAR